MTKLKVEKQGLGYIVACYIDNKFSHILDGAFTREEAETIAKEYQDGTR